MRKLVDTFVLICLLIGPAVILTCVRQPTEEEEVTEQIETKNIPIALANDEVLKVWK